MNMSIRIGEHLVGRGREICSSTTVIICRTAVGCLHEAIHRPLYLAMQHQLAWGSRNCSGCPSLGWTVHRLARPASAVPHLLLQASMLYGHTHWQQQSGLTVHLGPKVRPLVAPGATSGSAALTLHPAGPTGSCTSRAPCTTGVRRSTRSCTGRQSQADQRAPARVAGHMHSHGPGATDAQHNWISQKEPPLLPPNPLFHVPMHQTKDSATAPRQG
jgi:hypothetical protein